MIKMRVDSGNAQFAQRLLRWYDRNRRQLPWRVARGHRPDPYHVLVSEAMLQQTQVQTVVPYFNRLLKALPTLQDLAAADEQIVLRLWQGLGYYSRARNLKKAAERILAVHDGVVPSTVQELQELPGVGRYTAGAIASIAYDVRAPIVDGNVARVICRLDAIPSPPSERETQARLWARAAELIPRRRAGDFNSALMELGATVCTPRAPKCLTCPVRQDCQAFELELQDQIPPPRPVRITPLEHRQTFCVRSGINGRACWLIEQRPPRGRWAGMWQFVTVEATAQTPSSIAQELMRMVACPPRQIGTIEHTLTHRRYRFEVYLCELADRCRPMRLPGEMTRRWVKLENLGDYPLPRPHVRVAQILRDF
jgi:A/G-specific adenine glycosylase